MLDRDAIEFLREMTADVVKASRVRPGESVGDSPKNTTGQILIRPGGRSCYPATWVRDFSMALESNFIAPAETLHHFRLIARSQNGPVERRFKSGAIVPPFAIPDHVSFDGGVVFYPGTFSAGEDQGGEPFGVLPPVDDHYEFIHIAHHVIGKTNDRAILGEQIGNATMLDRLSRAFDAPVTDETTGGMVVARSDRRAVGFGFCDAIFLTGAILFASLLRWRAAREMRALSGDARYHKIADSIAAHIVPIFSDPKAKHGWLLAATEIGRQPDVWGTLYALHLKILPEDFAARSRQTIADAVRRGTITWEGAVRHVPTDFDFSPTSAWEKVAPGVAHNTYQNGAYWHTPTGWLIESLLKSDAALAEQVFRDYILHLRENDFRKGEQFGAPWECFGKDSQARQNAVYMTSVALPYAVLREI